MNVTQDTLGFNSSSLDKMAAISQTTFSNAFSWMEKFDFWLKVRSYKGPIDNNPALV